MLVVRVRVRVRVRACLRRVEDVRVLADPLVRGRGRGRVSPVDPADQLVHLG